MNEPGPIVSNERRAVGPVFISYATADRKEALGVCKAIERRGTGCWISTRDVAPGENYQEEIVRAIRDARAIVLLFSEAANHSDEIKKELSLASRHRVPVLALRIEDVEPSDAFAYELSTRQWIDAFSGRDKAIDALVRKLEQLGTAEAARPSEATNARAAAPPARRLPLRVLAAVSLTLAIGIGAWMLPRPATAPAHSMQVRLTGFERLSSDLPGSMPDAMRDEIIAAFGDDGVVWAITAPAPSPGTGPAYALGGTIRSEGNKIRVIARLTNERSNTTLWSNSFTYERADMPRIPRRVAIDGVNLVRCGLFGASTYAKPLPDTVLSNYLQYCHDLWNITFEPTKGLYFAHKVVAAAPSFSWGWSAVEISAWAATLDLGPTAERDALRAEALRAADEAIRLDRSNSEALAYKSALIDDGDLVGREALLKQALGARPLACGCEHHLYGSFLMEVGRTDAAVRQFQQSTDVVSLDYGSQWSLGVALLIAGRPEQAKPHLDAARALSPFADFTASMPILLAPVDGNYQAAVDALRSPDFREDRQLRTAIDAAVRALVSGNPAAKADASAKLAALPPTSAELNLPALLGALGANRPALDSVERAATAKVRRVRALLFLPSMAGALRDPSFPAVAQRLGLMRYWKTTHTRPDVCAAAPAPPFCRMI